MGSDFVTDPLERFGAVLLLTAFRRMAVFLEAGEAHTETILEDRLGIVPEYSRLFGALLSILERAGFVERVNGKVRSLAVVDDPALATELNDPDGQQARLVAVHPDLSAHAHCLRHCLDAYPDVLTGRRNHMEVLFPSGSMSLVEKIYKGNTQADACSRLAARVVRAYVDERRRLDPGARVTILEAGAGTGSTTSFILPALKAEGGPLRYLYTDLSVGFLEHGRSSFGAAYPFVEFRVFDLERPAEEQGIPADSVDLVAASNVLHATRDIRATLSRIKKPLRTNGLLLVNEVTVCHGSATLIFGLTGGWWRFEDGTERLPGSPLLNRERWESLLVESGFRNVRSFSPAGPSGSETRPQTVIVAESDGFNAGVSPEVQVATGSREVRDEPEIKRPAAPASSCPGGLEAAAREYVKSVFSEVLRIPPGRIADRATFEKYGVDSLVVQELGKRFERDLGQLPATLLFEYGTVEALGAHLAEKHQEALRRVTATETSPIAHAPAPSVPGAGTTGETGRAEPGEDLCAPFKVAVVGLAGRYPLSPSVADLWENLREGRNCVREIPSDRWDPEDPGFRASRGRWGGFLDGVDEFDPLFFGISPAEAERMDPEERLVLETVWHAVEDAALTRRTLARIPRVGVFIGCMYRQYPLLAGDPGLRSLLSSGSYWSIANRVSYTLDLKGPSLAVDTACSSSLTAVHLACESLRSGECGAAIAAGVNLSLHPGKYLALSEVGLLGSHSESRCMGDGDGLVPGEGVGAVVLKPLDRAIEDGDFIYGVILGTAANHGGKTGGFRVPNPGAQADLVETALMRAGVPAQSISYIELAANGSPLGDPIEVAALSRVFGQTRCSMGTVKSNLGHLEAASGISQLTKVLCQLVARQLVPTLNAEPLNPRVNLGPVPLTLQKRLTEWEASGAALRRAAISSFGAGGANAHVIVEERRESPREEPLSREELILLSAQNEDRLRAAAAGLARYLARFDRVETHFLQPPCLADIAFTLKTGREEMEERAAFIAGSISDLRGRLEAASRGQWNGVSRGRCEEGSGKPDPARTQDALLQNDLAELGRLWVAGVPIEWSAAGSPACETRVPAPRRIPLPGTAFMRRRCWVETSGEKPGTRERESDPAASLWLHPLVHTNTSTLHGIAFRSHFTGEELFLGEHVAMGKRVLPAAALVEMARAAGELAAGRPVVRLSGLSFVAPLVSEPGPGCHAEIRIHPAGPGAEFEIVDPGSGAVYARGNLHWESDSCVQPCVSPSGRELQDRIDGASLYRAFAESGLELGERFRTITSLSCGGGFARAEMRLDEAAGTTADEYVLHPALLDGGFQAVSGLRESREGLELPFWIDEVEIAGRIPRRALATASRSMPGSRFDIDVLGDAGEPVVKIRGLMTRPAVRGSSGVEGDVAPRSCEELTAPVDEAECARIETRLIAIAARMLKMEPGEVPVRREFTSYGFDSTSLIAFSRLVNESEGAAAVTPADLFEHSSIWRLARHLSQALRRERVAAGSVRTRPAVRKHNWTARTEVPIAIIGMSGVLPGSHDLDEFWAHLDSGDDLISEIPPDRWDWRAVWGDPRTEANKTRAKWGGFIPEVDCFDALFFGISPREAALMDPQQRLFLTAVWRTIEDAGYRPSDLARSRTGLWVGVASSDYSELIRARVDDIDGQISTGVSHAVLANRISFLLDLRGPSEPVDTACSSSLVAIHHAVEALRSGKCEMAIAGGVNVILSPTMAIGFSKAGLMSEDGRCKAFAKAADGYVRGEGVGALLLKPLDQALASGDTVRAVILATAVNHGGRAASLTAPNPEAQASLLEEAWRQAGIHPETLGYIEAHGTGTVLGDPIEVNGLKSAFSRFGPGPEKFEFPACGIGSVKSNIGHLETASGVAGVLKVVLAMRHGTLPPTLHVTEINPYLNLEGSAFEVIRDRRPWVRRQSREGREVPRRAGVSSFGFGGANAHVVLEEFEPVAADSEDSGPQVIVLSAKNEERLREAVRRLAGYLDRHLEDAPSLADLAFTLQAGREEMPARLAFVAESLDSLKARLADPSAVKVGRVTVNRDGERTGTAVDPDYVDYLLAKGKLSKLASLWVEGVPVDWRRLHPEGKRRRVPLPSYPFAPERHWVKARTQKPVAVPEPAVKSQHPLLDGDGFCKRLDPSEPIVAEHLAGGHPVLPAVASIEMALEAVRRARPGAPARLANVVFVEPIAPASGPVDLEVRLTGDGDILDLTIQSSGPAGPVTHVSGEVRLSRPGEGECIPHRAADLGLRGSESRSPSEELLAPEIYRRFREMGVTHGEYFRSLESLSLRESEADGWLSIPAAGRSSSFLLPPSLADGALQAAALLTLKAEGRPGLPFSVGEVNVRTSCPVSAGERYRVYAHRRPDGLLDVEVSGASGEPWFSFLGVEFRGISRGSDAIPLYVPRWIPEVLTLRSRAPFEGGVSIMTGPGGQALAEALLELHPDARILPVDGTSLPEAGVARIYFLGGIDTGPVALDDPLAIEEAQQRGVLALFRLVKVLQARGDASRFLELHIITNGVQFVSKRDTGRPAGAGLLGLAKSVGLEFPLWKVLCVDVDLSDTDREALGSLAAALAAEPGDEGRRDVAFRQGQRTVRSFDRLEAGDARGSRAGFREGGTYLIAGAGGIGTEVALYLARTFRARVALLGRRPSSPELTARVDEAGNLGGEIFYVTADLTDAASLAGAMGRIREKFGPLNGVFHTAAVFRDAMLTSMDEASFREVLAPKVEGSVLLARALRGESLDFVVFFSSIAGLAGGIGQANYAAATTFEDAFAQTLARRGELPAVALAWGFWGSAGAGMNERVARAMAAEGIGSIDLPSGMAALFRVVAEQPDGYCVALRAEPRALGRLGIPAGTPSEALTAERLASPAGQSQHERLRQVMAGVLQIDAERLDTSASLEDYGVDSLMALEVVKALEPHFGRVAPSDLFRHSTLDSLAEFLAARGGVDVAPPPGRQRNTPEMPPEIIPINRSGKHVPSFWVHGAPGFSGVFRSLSSALGKEYPVFAFQARGVDGKALPFMRISDMAAHYAECVKKAVPHGPYVLGGYSLGGVIAMETARLLHQSGEHVERLVFLDTYPNTSEVEGVFGGLRESGLSHVMLANLFLASENASSSFLTMADLEGIPPHLQLGALVPLIRERGRLSLSEDEVYGYLKGATDVSNFTGEAFRSHLIRPYDASGVLYFRSERGFVLPGMESQPESLSEFSTYDTVAPWRDLIRKPLEVVGVPCDHFNLLGPPGIEIVARRLSRLLSGEGRLPL